MDFLKETSWLRGWLVAAVIAHLITTIWHGIAHLQIPVDLTFAQAGFIASVIIILPLVGVSLLWSNRRQQAALLLAITMFGSLIFGIVNHFILDSPDYVPSVPHHEWQPSFVLSAALIIVPDAAGIVLAALAAVKWQR